MSPPGSGPGSLLSPASPRGPAAAWPWDTGSAGWGSHPCVLMALETPSPSLSALRMKIICCVRVGVFPKRINVNSLGWRGGCPSWGELLLCVQDVLGNGLTLLLKKLNQFEVRTTGHFLREQRGEAASCSSSTRRSCPCSSNPGFASCNFCLCKSSKTLHFKVPQVLGLQESSLYWCIKSSFVEITCIKPERFSFSQVGNEQTR